MQRIVWILFFIFANAVTAPAAEIDVMISGGFSAAYKILVPQFEKTTGNTVVTSYGPSMGETPQAIPVRLARGEPADVLIMVGDALQNLVAQGKSVDGSRVDLADSPIGIAIRLGAAQPDISTPEALKSALLAAKSIAYSDSASGVYVENELFAKLGIADQVRGKAHKIPAEPVGQVVARGDANIGFQQISEFKAVSGIDVIGPLPPSLQKITSFSAGVATGARQPDAARALIAFLSSPQANQTIADTGLVPKTKELAR